MTVSEIHFNDLSRYGAAAQAIMLQRGIIQPEETINDVFCRVVGTLVSVDSRLNNDQVDLDFVNAVTQLIENKTIILGTTILSNVGRKEGTTTAACTVLPLPVRQGILEFETFKLNSTSVLENAIGTGYDLSELDDPVAALGNINGYLGELNKSLIDRRKRPVASIATLRIDHPRILEFIRAKRDVDFYDWCINNSVFITEDLFEKAKQNKTVALIDRHGETTTNIPAQEILYALAESAHYCGEPGILFKDRFEANNPTPKLEYVSAAPCAEVAMAVNEVCQFSSVNLTELIKEEDVHLVFDFDKLRKSVAILTRLLDASTQITIDNEVDNNGVIAAKRRIGVGIAGFAGLLINLSIPYDSPEAVLLAAQISETVDFASKRASVNLAKERGPFPMFPESRFTDRKWLERKLPKTTGVIPKNDWIQLFDDLSRYGIRHATTTAFPPTGTSSRIVGTTASFEPALSLIGNQETERHVYDFVEQALFRHLGPAFQSVLALIVQNGEAVPDAMLEQVGRVFAIARQISFAAHLNIQAAVLSFADESGSKTINLPNATTVAEVLDIIYQAKNLGLKGLTIFRDGSLKERQM